MWEKTFLVALDEQRGAWETSMMVLPKLLASRFKQRNVQKEPFFAFTLVSPHISFYIQCQLICRDEGKSHFEFNFLD